MCQPSARQLPPSLEHLAFINAAKHTRARAHKHTNTHKHTISLAPCADRRRAGRCPPAGRGRVRRNSRSARDREEKTERAGRCPPAGRGRVRRHPPARQALQPDGTDRLTVQRVRWYSQAARQVWCSQTVQAGCASDGTARRYRQAARDRLDIIGPKGPIRQGTTAPPAGRGRVRRQSDGAAGLQGTDETVERSRGRGQRIEIRDSKARQGA
jgi:hypothetical protein